MNRIEKLFKEKNKNILSVFFTAGFPELESTGLIACALEKSGVDMIEIGMPFSDPIADGPVIQQSSKTALGNGMSVKVLLDQVKKIREKISVPLILMGYLNPVLQYGFEKFCKDAAQSGVDGLILPDLPVEEFERDYRRLLVEQNLLNIFLITPTTSTERIRKIDSLSNGFIYAISSSSTTGAKTAFSAEQENYFSRLQQMNLKNPFLVGFGVSSYDSFSAVNKYAAGAIIGSAFIKNLSEVKDVETGVDDFVHSIIQKPIKL